MEVKVAEKNIILKPIASRPGTSASLNFRPFSGLLASENAVAAIRPKTVRFKPPQLEAENNGKSTLVYKPLAKLVSRTTVSLLANMGKSDTGNNQALAQVEAQVQTSNLINPKVIYNHSPSNLGNEFSPTSEADHKTADSPTENGENDQKSRPRTNTVTGDRPSYDGYNWRKYGQKQVKGSEYPRSYYRCTHPDCPVKKKVERSIDGEIAEIVYKGEHNHSKPSHIIRRNTLGEQAQSMLSNGTKQDLSSPLLNNQLSDRNEGFQVGSSSLLTNLGKAPACFDSSGVNGVCEEERQVPQEVEYHDQRRSKRRKKATQLKEEAVKYGDGATEHHIVVQNATDSETAGDGFRWRKYGQKVVKGNSYPRSYYRCTGHKCKVRKHIERASDDPNAFITTYEGKHNHDMPVKNTHGTTSETVRKT